jgi:hypothetical protein
MVIMCISRTLAAFHWDGRTLSVHEQKPVYAALGALRHRLGSAPSPAVQAAMVAHLAWLDQRLATLDDGPRHALCGPVQPRCQSHMMVRRRHIDVPRHSTAAKTAEAVLDARNSLVKASKPCGRQTSGFAA